ncbi:MAG: Molybdopterin-synthase adenylyltransferase [Bacteroidota bacterium]|jgi:tRNA A37 threonylcarbamoyladenosine dehydratase
MIPDLKWLERTELLIGTAELERLVQTRVLIVGMGGVGSYAAEFICRAGVGSMTIVDGDVVDVTNKNRQLPALSSTVGKGKAALMAERLLDINPDLKLNVIDKFQKPDDTDLLVKKGNFDYVMDCIDSISPKLFLIQAALNHGVPIISSMGAGGKTDPWKMKVGDISKTTVCPFARNLRKRLRKMGIRKGVKTVYSTAPVVDESLKLTDGSNYKKSFYGTISFIPPLFGLLMAAEVINHLRKQE